MFANISRCTMDFVSNQLRNGRRLRILNIVDDYSREIVSQLIDFFNHWITRAKFFDQISVTRELRESIACDNADWLNQPDKPTQNAFVLWY